MGSPENGSRIPRFIPSTAIAIEQGWIRAFMNNAR
jgi:hypothetical protein